MSEVQSFKSLVSDLENTIEAETDNFFELAKIANLNPLTDFAGEDISQESLRCANLKGANLRETNLTESDLSYADLSYADLSYADLSYADLGFANLTNTDLTGANLQNTKFANNQGIDEKIRLKLIERGAVFNNQDTDRNISEVQSFKSLVSDLENTIEAETDNFFELAKIANLTNIYLTGANLQNTKFVNNQGIDEKIRLKLIERGAVFNSQDTDPNIIAYEKLKSDQKWFEKYQSKCVAFVDGDFVGSDEAEDKLRQRLRQSEYRDKWRFITEVGENVEIIDLPSSLWFDDLKLEL